MRISESPSGVRARKLLPEPLADLGAEEIYWDLTFPEPPPDRPYTAINMVSTADGKITAGGRAGGIGSRVDRLVMRLLRSRTDAVMVGAGTVRAEKINLGLPSDLSDSVRRSDHLGVILSASGEVPLENLIQNEGEREGERLLFITSRSTSERTLKRLSQRGEVRPELAGVRDDYRRVLELLRSEYGVDRLLVEGGPSVNRALMRHGLADELFLTFTPRLAAGIPSGDRASTILHGEELEPPLDMRLLSVYEADSELYMRYALKHIA